jgi:hypothetical protein
LYRLARRDHARRGNRAARRPAARTAGGDWLAPFSCVRRNLSTGQAVVKSSSILEATRDIRRR